VPCIRFETSARTTEFAAGESVNVLRMAIRHEVGLPWKCGSGRCGTDRILIQEGAEHLDAPRRRERERLGPLLEQGYRLACQTYTSGDLTVTWDPDQKGLDEGSELHARLKERWLAPHDPA
jgi:ferredoxin